MATIGVAACAATVQPGGGSPPTTVPDTPATTMWGTPSLPDQLVAVGDDGALAVVDTGTGERVVELASRAPEDGRRRIAGVSLAPDGATAWFDTRRPGGDDGRIYQVPTDGSADPVQAALGTYPEVSPSGGQLAFIDQEEIVVHGVVTDEERRWVHAGQLSDLAWSADGTHLLWVRDGTELWRVDVVGGGSPGSDMPGLVATAGAGETLSLPLEQGAGLVNVLVTTGPDDPTPERMLIDVGGETSRSPDTLGYALDRSYDASGSWGIRVTISHTIRWSGSGGIGTIATGYTAADW